MMEVFSETFAIGSDQVDRTRTMRPGALLTRMQEAALSHARALGLDSDRTLNRNLLWVVTRYYLEIGRLPRYEEVVTLETYPGTVRRVLFPRYFRMKDANGNVLMRASSVWVLIDGERRTMISPKQYGLEVYDGAAFGDELPYNMPAQPIPPTRSEEFTVPYSYLDLNGHMNNTKYFDLCIDLIADEVEGRALRSISAEFQNEIHYRETVSVSIGEQNGAYLFTGTTEKPCFRIGMQYEAPSDDGGEQ
ncbi:MAG: hypothetical protein IJP98_03990 [Clostridia bacterium]|nr:hypothetical protein [Clostridia bacterium]